MIGNSQVTKVKTTCCVSTPDNESCFSICLGYSGFLYKVGIRHLRSWSSRLHTLEVRCFIVTIYFAPFATAAIIAVGYFFYFLLFLSVSLWLTMWSQNVSTSLCRRCYVFYFRNLFSFLKTAEANPILRLTSAVQPPSCDS